MPTTITLIPSLRIKTAGFNSNSSNSNTNSSTNNSRLSLSSSNLLTYRTYLNGPGAGKYGRQSSIGIHSNDLTLTKSPAFSIGKAARFNDSYPLLQRSPGPIYSPIMIKKRSPTFFISSRYRELNKFITPGPGDYAPEKHFNPFKSSVPAFSMGKACRWPTILA